MKKIYWLLCIIGMAQSIHADMYQVGSIEFEMTNVDGGEFLMGAQKENPQLPNYDPDAMDDESPVHSVRLDSYAIGTYPVTQELWFAVTKQQPVEGDTHQWFSECGYGVGYPAYYIGYTDALAFIAALNDSLRASGQLQPDDFFRLPTEAEWEYAARGGKQSHGFIYAGSNAINEVGWYSANSPVGTQMVGLKKPNELGLYDMSGNVLEWCSDYYGDYADEEQNNPTGSDYSRFNFRIVRGGCYPRQEHIARVSARLYEMESRRLNYQGMRLVLQRKVTTGITTPTKEKSTKAHIVMHKGEMYIEYLANGCRNTFTLTGQRINL